jgi:hypothetical protein
MDAEIAPAAFRSLNDTALLAAAFRGQNVA